MAFLFTRIYNFLGHKISHIQRLFSVCFFSVFVADICNTNELNAMYEVRWGWKQRAKRWKPNERVGKDLESTSKTLKTISKEPSTKRSDYIELVFYVVKRRKIPFPIRVINMKRNPQVLNIHTPPPPPHRWTAIGDSHSVVRSLIAHFHIEIALARKGYHRFTE